MTPPCDRFVPGYGDVDADVHVVGDYPGRHGGAKTGVPFTGTSAGRKVQEVFELLGLLSNPGDEPTLDDLYVSYLHPCDAPNPPTERSYLEQEPFFDAEIRAITAHVLVPVGDRPVEHVLKEFTTYPPNDRSTDAVHATEISGGAWLVVPAAEPAEWTDEEAESLLETLKRVLARDYRRESDLSRFLADSDPYLVR
ncbi:MAG: uracil-DNA glycosylase family protein [Halanaeroarchaeum sp.]